MGQPYTTLDRVVLLGSMALITLITYRELEAIRNAGGGSYLTVWPLDGLEVVLLFLVAFIVASIYVYRDWKKQG